MPTIELPDKGVSLEFPDSMSEREISDAIQAQFYSPAVTNMPESSKGHRGARGAIGSYTVPSGLASAVAEGLLRSTPSRAMDKMARYNPSGQPINYPAVRGTKAQNFVAGAAEMVGDLPLLIGASLAGTAATGNPISGGAIGFGTLNATKAYQQHVGEHGKPEGDPAKQVELVQSVADAFGLGFTTGLALPGSGTMAAKGAAKMGATKAVQTGASLAGQSTVLAETGAMEQGRNMTGQEWIESLAMLGAFHGANSLLAMRGGRKGPNAEQAMSAMQEGLKSGKFTLDQAKTARAKMDDNHPWASVLDTFINETEKPVAKDIRAGQEAVAMPEKATVMGEGFTVRKAPPETQRRPLDRRTNKRSINLPAVAQEESPFTVGQATTEPVVESIVTRSNGKPFASEAAATKSMKSQRINGEVVPMNGGFAIKITPKPKPEAKVRKPLEPQNREPVTVTEQDFTAGKEEAVPQVSTIVSKHQTEAQANKRIAKEHKANPGEQYSVNKVGGRYAVMRSEKPIAPETAPTMPQAETPKASMPVVATEPQGVDRGAVAGQNLPGKEAGAKTAQTETEQPARPSELPEPTMAQPKRVSTTPAVKSETVEEAIARGVKPKELPPATKEMAKAEEVIDREAVNLGATETPAPIKDSLTTESVIKGNGEKPSNGWAFVNGQQRPFTEHRTIKTGRDKGKIEIVLPNGKKARVAQKDVVRMPEEAKPLDNAIDKATIEVNARKQEAREAIQKDHPNWTAQEVERGAEKTVRSGIQAGVSARKEEAGRESNVEAQAVNAEPQAPEPIAERTIPKPPISKSIRIVKTKANGHFPARYIKSIKTVMGTAKGAKHGDIVNIIDKDGKPFRDWITNGHLLIKDTGKIAAAKLKYRKLDNGNSLVWENIKKVIDESRLDGYIEAKDITTRDGENWSDATLSNDNKRVVVDPNYIGLFKQLYPKAKFFIRGEHEAIMIKDGNDVVGVAMPIRFGYGGEGEADVTMTFPLDLPIGKAEPINAGATHGLPANKITPSIKNTVNDALAKAPEIEDGDRLDIEQAQNALKKAKYPDAQKAAREKYDLITEEMKKKYGTVTIESPTGVGWKYNIINTKYHLENFKTNMPKETGRQGITLASGLGGAQPYLEKLGAKLKGKEKTGEEFLDDLIRSTAKTSVSGKKLVNETHGIADALASWKDKSRIPFVKHTRSETPVGGGKRTLAKLMDDLGVKGERREKAIRAALGMEESVPETVSISDLSKEQQALVRNFVQNASVDIYGKALLEDIQDYHNTVLSSRFIANAPNLKDIPRWSVETITAWRIPDIVDNTGELYKHTTIPYEDANHALRSARDQVSKDIRALMPGVSKGSKLSAQLQDFAEKKISLEEISPRWRDKIQTAEQYTQQKYNEWIDRVNEARALVGKAPIKRRNDYFTHGQEINALSNFFGGADRIPNEVAKNSQFSHPNSPFFKYEKRLGGEYVADGIGNFLAYADNALRVIHFTPVIVEAKAYIRHLPPNAHEAMQSWADEILAGKTSHLDKLWDRSAGIVIPRKAATWVRTRMVKNIVIGSGRILVQQPSSFAQTFAELATGKARNLKDVALNISDAFAGIENSLTNSGKHILAESREYRDRMYIDDIDPALLNKAEKALSYLNAHVDRAMVSNAFLGKYRQLMRQGSTHADAIIEADKFAKRSQASYQKGNLNAILRSESGKNVLPLQTFTFNMLNHLAFDVPKMIAERGKAATFAYGLTLMGGFLAVNAAYDALHMAKTWDWTSIFPLAGNVKYGASGPLGIIYNLAKLGFGDKRAKGEAKMKLRSVPWQILPPFGGDQIRKSIDGYLSIDDQPRSDLVTKVFGHDKPYTIEGDWDRLMAVVFGPSSTNAGREYWEKRDSSASKRIADYISNESSAPSRPHRTGRSGRPSR